MENQKLTLKELILTAIIIILLIFTGYNYFTSKKEINDVNNAWKYEKIMRSNNESTLKRTIGKKNETIVSQQALIVTEKQATEMALLENERLKKIKSKVTIITETVYKDIFIPFETTIHDTISGDSAQPFEKKDEWFFISGVAFKNGVRVDLVSFTDSLTVTIGSERKNIFKKRVPTVDMTSHNPHSNIKGAYNVIIVPPKKMFIETTVGKILIGVAGGVLLSTQF